ncbi:uncharacterized protein LOC141617142 isoform X2 [Silene latifolia]
MTSLDSKDIHGIENLDRISQLPEPMILNILSRLSLEDSGRASILSKTWKSFCSLYPILYLDQNLFALQSLVSANEGGGEPDINQIRDMFMNGVDYQLSRVKQQGSPIRKLALYVAMNDTMYYPRVDKWMELVKQIIVEDLCITLQNGSLWWNDFTRRSSVVYEIPFSVLASKGLLSAYIRECNLGCETLVGDPINKVLSLQRLCLSHVFMDDRLLENLIRCFQGLEALVLDNCGGEIKFLQLSKFPKLKKAVISVRVVDYVDVVDTNLECFRCDAQTQLHINPDACASIRELALHFCVINQHYLFKDLTATFPLLEEGDFHVKDTDTLKAANNVLRKLKFCSYGQVCVNKLHVDCPSLTVLKFSTKDLSELYIDCPKLRVFSYNGTAVPDHVFCNSMANLEESHCDIAVDHAYDYDTLWLLKLRAFLILVIGNATNLKLTFALPMAKFEPEKVDAFQVSSQYNVHLQLVLFDMMQNIAALVDGLLWIIRPTTMTFRCGTYYLVKYLCENLITKQKDNTCDEQLTHPCWMHQLEDFDVECPLNVPVTKKNLVTVPEQCQILFSKQVRFIFHWRRN